MGSNPTVHPFNLDRIFLFSHARSCSSLLSHILGNNPLINGYYEMRQGYTSIADLNSQIQHHTTHHDIKTKSKYIFDNVVFDQYLIGLAFLSQCNPKIIITLGNPHDSIPSLMELKSKKVEPLATFSGACTNYVNRTRVLLGMAEYFKGQFIYLDANDVVMRTEECFRYLESELDLDTPLSTKYELFPMSTICGAGDPSTKLKSGVLMPGPRARKHNKNLNYDQLARIEKTFLATRDRIINLAKPNKIYDPNSDPAVYT